MAVYGKTTEPMRMKDAGTAVLPMKRTGMRFNLYVPDALGERAKAADLPLSRIFQDALERELGAVGPRAELRRNGDLAEITVSIPLGALGRWVDEQR